MTGSALRGLRARRGFVEALLALPDRSLELGLDAVDMIGDALDEGALADLAEWEIAVHPGVYALPIGEDRFLTASIASEGGEPVVYLERCGGPEVLAEPRAARRR